MLIPCKYLNYFVFDMFKEIQVKCFSKCVTLSVFCLSFSVFSICALTFSYFFLSHVLNKPGQH